MDVGNLISGSSAFSKSSLNIWRFMVHVLLKPGLENLEHHFARVWDECNCTVVWAFFGIVFHWDWNENWSFPVLWPRTGSNTFDFLPLYSEVAWEEHTCTRDYWQPVWLVDQGLEASLKDQRGTSLVVQWLNLHTLNAGAQVQSLTGELDPTCCS